MLAAHNSSYSTITQKHSSSYTGPLTAALQWLPHMAEAISSILILVIVEAVNTVSNRFVALVVQLGDPHAACNSSEEC